MTLKPLTSKEVQRLSASKSDGVFRINDVTVSLQDPTIGLPEKRLDTASSLRPEYFELSGTGDRGYKEKTKPLRRSNGAIQPAESDLKTRIAKAQKQSEEKFEKKRLDIHFQGKHGRVPDQQYFIKQMFGNDIPPQISPKKASKEANKRKNEFYESMVEQSRVADRVKTTESEVTKHEMYSKYVTLTEACDSETTLNRKYRSGFGRRMGRVRSNYSKLERRLDTKEKEN